MSLPSLITSRRPLCTTVIMMVTMMTRMVMLMTLMVMLMTLMITAHLVQDSDMTQLGRHLGHQERIRVPTWCHLALQSLLLLLSLPPRVTIIITLTLIIIIIGATSRCSTAFTSRLNSIALGVKTALG